MVIGLMTQLEAVNRLLAATGDSPIQSLDEHYQQAELALATLERVSRNLQAKGWYFNEEEDILLNKDISNRIVLPANILKVDITSDGNLYAQRGIRIYDKINQTYTIEEDVTANIVTYLVWDDLPHTAREAIVAEASLVFYEDFYGSETIPMTLKNAYTVASIALQKADVKARDINLLGNSRVQNIAFSNRR